MLAVLVGQASAEVILPWIAGDNMQDYSEQKFTKERDKVESAGRLWLFCNKNHGPDPAYPKPSYGWGWSSCSSDYHQLGNKDISSIQQDGL